MCLKEIGPNAQNLLTILSRLNSQHNWQGPIREDLHFDSELRYSYKLQKLQGKWLQTHFGFANYLSLKFCGSYPTRVVQREKCPFKTQLP